MTDQDRIREIWRRDKRLILSQLGGGRVLRDGVWFEARFSIEHNLPVCQLLADGKPLICGWIA